MMRSWVMFVSILLLGGSLAGCMDPQGGADEDDAAEVEVHPGEGTRFDAWPPLEEATIRPGIQINTVGHGWCTTNFVFTDAEGEVYLGTAAHCVDHSVGAAVRMQQDPDFVTGEEGPVIGRVWYSAWVYENYTTESCNVIFSCASGSGGNSSNDFALIKIDEAYRGMVHPAVIHYGGPTGVAPLDELAEGDRVLTQGNSPLRPGPTPADSREGYITSINAPWTVTACIVTPGVPGDSGSNALLGDGRALGIVVTLGGGPCLVANGITVLETALDYAAERGYEVGLATWELLEGGVLP